MKVMSTPEAMPGAGKWRDDGDDRAQMPSAQIEARLHQRTIHTVQRRIERQHHERQVDVNEAEDHGEIVVVAIPSAENHRAAAGQRTSSGRWRWSTAIQRNGKLTYSWSATPR